MMHRKTDSRKRGIRFAANRRAAALSSAAMISALWSFDPASGAVNSFSPGVSITFGASLNDPTNWSLGHVPGSTADQNEQIVIPTGGQVNGAVTNTFDGANIVGATLTHAGSAGRVLVNNSSTPATLQLNGLAGQPTIWDNTNSFQFSIGTATTNANVNNINLILGSTDNEFRNSTNGSPNVMRIYADISQLNPHTNITLTTPNGVGSIVLGGNNSFNGVLNIQAGTVGFDYSIKNGSMIASDGSIIFNGGTITATGNAAGTNQAVAMSTFNAGSTNFIFGSNGAITTSTFNLGPLVRNNGATANLEPAPTNSGAITQFKTSTPNTNGILGGWITIQDGSGSGIQNVFTYDWAANDGSGNVVHFSNYQNKNDLTTWADNDNINGTAPFTGSVGNVSINSLRLDNVNAVTNITTTGLLTIKSGGVLVQNPVGSGLVTTSLSFVGSGALTSGTTDLIFFTPGIGNSGGFKNVYVQIPIQDQDATHPVGITKNDSGFLTILGSDTYSGDVHINEGSLNIDTLANKGSPSSLGTNGIIYVGSEGNPGMLNFGAGTTGTTTLPGAGPFSTDRDFVFGPSGAFFRLPSEQITFTGNLSGGELTKFGVGSTATFVGAKTYSGIVIGAGTLEVDSIANLGVASGLGTGLSDSTITLGNGNSAALSYVGTTDASTNRPIAVNAKGQVIKVDNGGTPVNLTLTGPLSGSFDLQKLGSGTLVISGSKTYSGTLTIGKGDLSIDTAGALGTGAANSGGAATITLGNTNTATLTFTGASDTTARPFVLKTQAGQFGGIESTAGTLVLTGGIDTNGKALALDGAGTVNVNSAIIGAGSITKNGAGTGLLTGTNSYTGTTTVTGGTLQFAGSAAWGPAINGPGFTDIQHGRVVLDYSGGDPSPAATVKSLLTTSFASGFATGQIRSTTATANKGLGYADDGSKVTIAYTYFGDANVDGIVDTSDFTALSQHFGDTNLATPGSPTWSEGDFNYDGKINALDFNAISTNFGSPSLAAPALGSVVPEPEMFAIIGAIGLLVRRRRNR